MDATADRPSSAELDQLAGLLAADPLDRAGLAACLGRVAHGLREHAAELDRSGGLLDDADKANRMSLAREDERLRDEISALLQQVSDLARDATVAKDDKELRRRGAAVLAGLRGHRDAEASLVLESTDTEVGSGD